MKTIYVVIESTRGSTPRDTGTAMAVTACGIKGTIGGGTLEHQAIARARTLLAEGREMSETVPLGPGLGQCCGGTVRLRYTFEPRDLDTAMHNPLQSIGAGRALWLWGAGHVGRAFVRLAPRDVDIIWVDDDPARFPAEVPPHVETLPATDMPRLAARAAQGADHLIFTYSHEIDLALCAALLQREVRSIGLIGSDTKWARFSRRLRASGLDPSGITCPIGDKSMGKHPDAIARGTLEALLVPMEKTA